MSRLTALLRGAKARRATSERVAAPNPRVVAKRPPSGLPSLSESQIAAALSRRDPVRISTRPGAAADGLDQLGLFRDGDGPPSVVAAGNRHVVAMPIA